MSGMRAAGAITVVVVVSTANHFVLDVLAGAATTLLAGRLARRPGSGEPGEEAARPSEDVAVTSAR